MLPPLKVCTQGLTLADQIVGWLLTVGTFVSFVPQMVSLVAEKNLDGLSALTWALNFLSNMATFVNAVLLNWNEIECCQELSPLKCVENLVPLVQLFMPTISTFIIFLLTAVYSTNMTDKQIIMEEELKLNMKRSTNDFFAFIFGSNSFVRPLFFASVVAMLAAVGAGALLVIFVGVHKQGTIMYANVVGIIAVVFLMVMYIPQLYTTFKVKHQGSLSLTTLLIQCPGSLAVVYFDAFQNHMSWTTWLPYLVSAIQQFVLIIMCIYYYFRNKKQPPPAGESDPLISATTSSSYTSFPTSPSPTTSYGPTINY